MAKTGYRFNPETLSYDRIHVSVKKKLWSLVVKFFSSLSLALVIFLIVSAIVDSPKEKALKREKEEIQEDKKTYACLDEKGNLVMQ